MGIKPTRSEFSARTRLHNLQALGRELFDILIVGGGITGAGIARDAAMRRYKVALIDKGDFASGTSSKSSKLVHGGLRYLEMFEFGLVYEASRERRTLLQIAPHLVRLLPFLFPIYRDARWAPWMIDVGMWVYDGLGMFRNVQRHKMFSPKQIKQMMGGIDTGNISGGAYYYDAQVDDARLTLETIRAAHWYGAVTANYIQVDALLKERGRVVGARAHNVLRGDPLAIRARVVVNATGPWTDALLQLDDPHAPRRLRPTKGIHILVPCDKIGCNNDPSHLHCTQVEVSRGGIRFEAGSRVPRDYSSAVAFPAYQDGRLMFIIPWGAFSIIGTTDTDFDGDYDRVYADANDVDYVIAAVNHAFPDSPIQKSDVISTYAGLRPLVLQAGKSATKTSREHEIWTSASGLVTIAGGKLTTYRSMAQRLVDLVAQRLRDESHVVPARPCSTARTALVEVDGAVPPNSFGEGVMAHLVHAHGPERGRVLDIAQHDAHLAQPIVEGLPYLWAEVRYAIEQEMALTVTDVLARRMHVLNESRDNGIAAAPEVAARLGEFLDWDKAKIEKELRAYEEEVELTRKFK
jgi:glycerol-3-phosphate dehydrogenase